MTETYSCDSVVAPTAPPRAPGGRKAHHVAHQRWEGSKDPFEVDEVVDRCRFGIVVQILAGGGIEHHPTARVEFDGITNARHSDLVALLCKTDRTQSGVVNILTGRVAELGPWLRRYLEAKPV